MAEFSKLNGYDVKDAVARQALTEKVSKTDIVDGLASDAKDRPLSANQGFILDTRLKELEDAGSYWLDDDAIPQHFNTALQDHAAYGSQILYQADDKEVCTLIGYSGHGQQTTELHFYKISTNEIISFSYTDESDTVTKTITKVDKPITVEYDEDNETLTIGE